MAFRWPIFILLCLSIFISCRKEPESIPEPVEEQAIETSVSSLSKYGGFWLSESYVNAIKELKSVDSATFIYESMALALEITPDTISNRVAGIGFYWHAERSSEKVYPDKNQRLVFKPKNPDGPLKPFILSLIDNNKIEAELTDTGKKEYYVRYKNQFQALNTLLFAGSYRDVLSGKNITLTIDGKVTGIPDVLQYNPVFQFDESNIEGVDALFFYKDRNPDKMGYDYNLAYQYKFKGDTLQLYEVPDDYGIEPGPLKYKLVKE